MSNNKLPNGYENIITVGKMTGRINGQRRGYLFLNLLTNGKRRKLIFKFTKWKRGKRSKEIIIGLIPLEAIRRIYKKALEYGKIGNGTRGKDKVWEYVDHTKGQKFTKSKKKEKKKPS